MKRLTLASVFLSGVLMAGMGNNMPSYSDFDADGNGEVTQTEFENAQQTRMTEQAEAGKQMRNAGNAPTFEDVDTNNDGVLTQVEFQNHQKTQMQERMNQNPNMGQGKGMGQGNGARQGGM
ncbi:MAG: hypothetical protein AUK54_02900 [Helicobacteraceae bacterium CG2_30_36_10]|nr:MAG: hypothetical protein AUK54_02900 [Helicobacteraceae bacterium CG2_30_36_10]